MRAGVVEDFHSRARFVASPPWRPSGWRTMQEAVAARHGSVSTIDDSSA
jgi:hypothetical protein